ncbi:Two component transcriptional regulator, winged helix family [Hyella patelloides LEGE 07179]|uniref:Two component transcriptional regulator, winged helix family n=1 Tax=Hyella patelloides LEGE 07179 TaxID=945734 RepID=A0A563VU79_9CYAN|nr:response regulator transcription factor [Hyella patelloides]VEP14939.1 Two component transcriptional regulator, winged helix family [Hyella patelloides LEGE 07179]
MKLLLVEDDREISELLTEVLIREQYLVDLATDGEEGWDFIKACDYDLLLLDVMLPKLNGVELCRRLRAKEYPAPIMMLTALDSSESQIQGLDAGADDYVIKPYKLGELLARIRALLRRKTVSVSPVLRWGDLSFDTNICKASYNNQALKLTPKEYQLLELFLRNGNNLLSRSKILDNLWSFEEPPDENTVKAHMRRLRKKLSKAGATDDFIETVYGLGYRLKQQI